MVVLSPDEPCRARRPALRLAGSALQELSGATPPRPTKTTAHPPLDRPRAALSTGCDHQSPFAHEQARPLPWTAASGLNRARLCAIRDWQFRVQSGSRPRHAPATGRPTPHASPLGEPPVTFRHERARSVARTAIWGRGRACSCEIRDWEFRVRSGSQPRHAPGAGRPTPRASPLGEPPVTFSPRTCTVGRPDRNLGSRARSFVRDS